MVPLTTFLQEELLLLTQLSQELPLVVRAQGVPGPPPTAAGSLKPCCSPKGDPAACGDSLGALQQARPVQQGPGHCGMCDIPMSACERGGSASPVNPGPRGGRQERATRGGIRSPGLAGQESRGPYDFCMLTTSVCLPYPGAK